MGGTDFWSRRKAGVETEEKIALRDKDAEETAVLQAEQAEKTDEELLLELDLPNPDEMKMGDDFSAFMSKTVPDRLRRRALRCLWLANPALANLDGLIDYGEDFTDSATVIENMQTAYQVGKGMTEHVLEMARQAEDQAKEEAAKQLAAEEADGMVSGELPGDMAAVEDAGCTEQQRQYEGVEASKTAQTQSTLETHNASQTAEILLTYDGAEAENLDPAILPQRRMVFHFDDMKEPQL
ncbi:MAG: DUF3306 domain-containing protein [Paracoccaceae bacterium]|jgi:hypothetical protein|nr:DUF3306 domain-containing protein [Paracoccaceae bacterium]|tara:strand:+ start:772 stop:1488 length:717 start_codon:yes stop_codon:yes gene_type:complete